MKYLNDIWSIYFHDPYDFNWDEKSYKFISTISTVEDFVQIFYVFKDLFHKGMFFLMREHIMPRWEDENNRNGGCFSFKIGKLQLEEKLFEICSQILGETFGKNAEFSLNVNGISVSHKKNHYLIRIWIKDNKFASKDNYNLIIPKFSTLMYKIHAENE